MTKAGRIGFISLFIFLFAGIVAYAADDDKRSQSSNTQFYAHGPRLGCTLLYNGNEGTWGIAMEDSLLLEKDIPLLISQFGYHVDFSVFTSNQINPVIQFDGLIGGVEQGLLLPSLSMLVGLRFSEQFEFGIGPNISLSGTGVVAAIGYNFKNEDVYFPVNFAVVYSEGYFRFTLLAGFNFPDFF